MNYQKPLICKIYFKKKQFKTEQMKYRGISYYYKEWTTWNGKQASAYYCDDESLLRDLQLKSFGESTREEMHSRIDYIINNYDKEIEKQVLSDKAALEFYNLK